MMARHNGIPAMQNRTIHPAEFAGWRPSMVDAALWQTILWAGTDDNGEPLERNYDMSAAWREDMERLSREFYAWRDAADDVLLGSDLGDLCLQDLLGVDRVEHCYVLVRDGHGVSMADRWQADSPEAACCRWLERLAKAQGPIGAMTGDDGRLYLSWSI
jgi:hypothetical protein